MLALVVISFTKGESTQWSLVSLHPEGANDSRAYAGAAGRQFGRSTGIPTAGYWTGTAASFTTIDVTGLNAAGIAAATATHMGGSGVGPVTASENHAFMWSIATGIGTDLHPPGVSSSAILAMSGAMQGGYVWTGSSGLTERAAIWSGTANSYVDLHPVSETWEFKTSRITAMAGTQRVGHGAILSGPTYALLWSGSPATVTVLFSGDETMSMAYAMTTTRQGGAVRLSGYGTDRAAIWSGTGSSRVILHPPGASTSQVLAMTGDYQAGHVDFQAAVWQGSAESYVDLHAEIVDQLGPDYTHSQVNGAYEENGHIYLVGQARDTAREKTIAVLWTNSPALVAPSVVIPPLSQAVNAGATARLAVSVAGTAPLGYQWRKNGAPIEAPSAATLVLNDISAANAGDYDVIVSNAAGSVTSAAGTLSVNPIPTLGVRHVLAPGEDIDLDVAVTSTGTATYQWLHNFQVIPGANSTILSLTNVTYAANGHYELLITDDLGTRRSAPIFITIAPEKTQVIAWGDSYYGQKNVPVGLDDCIAVACGSQHVLALRRDGSVVAWGWDSTGQATVPEGLDDVVAIAAAGTYSMALKADGTVVQWGQQGLSLKPIHPDLRNVVAIYAHDNYGFAHKWDASITRWGTGGGMPGTPPLPSNMDQIRSFSVGNDHALAIKLDGSVQAWGSNAYGQSAVPDTLTDPIELSAGYIFSLGLNADGAVFGWGDNYNNATDIPEGLANVISIKAGYNGSLALRENGVLVAWGESFVSDVPATAVDVFAMSSATFGHGDFALAIREAPSEPILATITFPNTGTIYYDGTPKAVSVTTNPPGLFTTITYDGSTTPPTNAGRYTVIATITDEVFPVYSGSASGTLTIAKASQWITFPEIPDRGYTPSPIELHATASSGLPVSFTVLSGPASVEGNQLTLSGTGVVNIRATQNGDINHTAAYAVGRSFTVTANASSWRELHFTPTELVNEFISGLTADPDRDGLTNLLEYALGLDPMDTDTSGLPEAGSSATDWTYTYTRPADRPDLTYEVEYSTDLATWSTAGITHTMTADHGSTQTRQGTLPLNSATNVFFRLKITQN